MENSKLNPCYYEVRKPIAQANSALTTFFIGSSYCPFQCMSFNYFSHSHCNISIFLFNGNFVSINVSLDMLFHYMRKFNINVNDYNYQSNMTSWFYYFK